jgi:hypothetical protein
MLDGTLPERSQNAALRVSDALSAKALHVSIGSFLDLRYLVDSGRRPSQVLDDARSIVDGEGFTVVPLNLPIIDKMASIPTTARWISPGFPPATRADRLPFTATGTTCSQLCRRDIDSGLHGSSSWRHSAAPSGPFGPGLAITIPGCAG